MGSAGQTSLATVVERSYRLYAGQTAVIDGERRCTYAELGSRVHRVADALRRQGFRRGDRIVLLSRNSREFWEVEHALAVGGFVRVALTPRLHPREVDYIVRDCGAVAAFADEEWAEPLREIAERAPELRWVVELGGPEYEDLLADADEEPPAKLPGSRDVCALLYTSGTTGRPKGATLSHGNLVAMIRSVQTELPPIDTSDVILHVAPLTHMSGGCAFTFYSRGATQALLPTFDPDGVLEAIERLRVTAIPLVPTMLNLLTEVAEARPRDTSSLRTLIYGASPIAPDRLVRAIAVFGDVFVQLYGLSEAVMPLAAMSQRDHMFDSSQPPPARLASAGRPHPFFELRIVGDDGHDVLTGEEGEIVVRGDTVMIGYWNQPEMTAEMIDEDGWAHTGDVGRLDEEGYLYIVDRKKDMIVSGGFNVYPSEVEHAILTLRGVQAAAVFAVPDKRWGEAVAAAVVVRPGHSVSEEDVVSVCREHLARYKAPKVVHFVESLPTSGAGKILRREVRDRFWAGRERRVS
jgi:long-chain acyl-CoA synthetase